MDVTDRDHGDAGHGDDELAVLLDALDEAFGALVDAVDNAHVVARVVLRRIGAEIFHVASGVRRGHQDEGAHLAVADGTGLVGLSFRVVHEILVVIVFELHQPLLGTAHEEQGRDELLLLVGEAAAIELLDGVDRDIGLDACR